MVLDTRGWEVRRGVPFNKHNREVLYPENSALSSDSALVSLERLLDAQASQPTVSRHLLLKGGGSGLGPHSTALGGRGWHVAQRGLCSCPSPAGGYLASFVTNSGIFFPTPSWQGLALRECVWARTPGSPTWGGSWKKRQVSGLSKEGITELARKHT